jgi:hypothetical protein
MMIFYNRSSLNSTRFSRLFSATAVIACLLCTRVYAYCKYDGNDYSDGTVKKLDDGILYVCVDPKWIKQEIFEGRKKITITKALYGYQGWRNNVQNQIAGYCNTKQRCEFEVTNALFGDPYHGPRKNLIIEWQCGDVSHSDNVPEDNNNKGSYAISCPGN